MTAKELAALRDQVARAELGMEPPAPPKPAVFDVKRRPAGEPRYPVTGRASIIECPVHDLIVALNDSGRICSPCPGCQREAQHAIGLVSA